MLTAVLLKATVLSAARDMCSTNESSTVILGELKNGKVAVHHYSSSYESNPLCTNPTSDSLELFMLNLFTMQYNAVIMVTLKAFTCAYCPWIDTKGVQPAPPCVVLVMLMVTTCMLPCISEWKTRVH